MTKHLLALAVVTTAFGLPQSAAAQLVVVEWDAGGQFTKETSVPAGKFTEVCEKLVKGSTVAWSFEAGAKLDFNIHYHEGKKIHFPARKNQMTKANGTLNVKFDHDYCWMWSSKATTETALKLALKRS